MTATYKAVEVTSFGKLNLVTRPVPKPGPGQVRVRVEAAGICHSDVATVDARFPGILYPRVPGHEIPGHIDASEAVSQAESIGRQGKVLLVPKKQ